MNPFDLFNSLTPDPHATPTELNRWRNKIAMVLFLLVLGMTGAPWIAEWRYAKADELGRVHEEIRQEIQGIKGSIDNLSKSYEQKDKAREEREKAEAVREIRRQIYSTQKDACAAEGMIRELLLQQVQELRSDYMALTGTEYPDIACPP